MRRAIPAAWTLLILSAAAAGSPLAAQAPPADAGLEQEVRRLNVTLSELVELLRRQLESSNAAVLMQRVQLMTSRMAPAEEELRTARAALAGAEGEKEDLELSVTNFAAQIERDLAEGNITDEQARLIREQQDAVLEQRTKQIQGRIWSARQRVIDLEQDLAVRRAELETWEGEIDRVLGLR